MVVVVVSFVPSIFSQIRLLAKKRGRGIRFLIEFGLSRYPSVEKGL